MKLSWLSTDNKNKEYFLKIKEQMMIGPSQCLLSLKLLAELVNEMNYCQTNMRNSIHRKIYAHFRDTILLDIFKLSLTTTEHVVGNNFGQLDVQTNNNLIKELVSLIQACLNYDFVGTNPYASEEEASVVQIPMSWKSVFENTNMLKLFYLLFQQAIEQNIADILECLRLAVSCRRALFAVKKRAAFFQVIVDGLLQILTKNQEKIKSDRNIHHNCCRFILQTKRNYRLSEILATNNHRQWLTAVADFTAAAIDNWQFAFKGVHYLLGFWTRLVSDLPYLKIETDIGTTFDKVVPVLCTKVITSRITTIPNAITNDSLNEMFTEGNMHIELRHLPILFRYQYEHTITYLKNNLLPAIESYKSMLSRLGDAFKNSSSSSSLAVSDQNSLISSISIIDHN